MLPAFFNIDLFVYPFNIPANEYLADSLEKLCLLHQRKELQKILGAELFAEFEADYYDNVFHQEKFIKLVEGDTYDIESVTIEWLGLANLFTPFIFMKYYETEFNTKVYNSGGNLEIKNYKGPKIEGLLKLGSVRYQQLKGRSTDSKYLDSCYNFLNYSGFEFDFEFTDETIMTKNRLNI